MKFLLWIFHVFLSISVESTIDINYSEYQYLADRLTDEECHTLIAALHFQEFELPNGLNAAERRLPNDVPCIDLLFHWNSAVNEGKGETHVQVCHRLNQIGRDDLAQWLSKTVFHHMSENIGNYMNFSKCDNKSCLCCKRVEINSDEEVPIDEAAWLSIDTFLSILFVFGVLALLGGSFVLCFLCTSSKKAQDKHGYSQLSNAESQ
ncbi:hypothetical protein RUM44_011068 [Polyplax serrata]|uniref:Death domain-containing protein n=1 Tax=Polyplax serrata TaxID=468196 RepID=A0ABR1APA1_POLSC